jgi:hypothetical protein
MMKSSHTNVRIIRIDVFSTSTIYILLNIFSSKTLSFTLYFDFYSNFLK